MWRGLQWLEELPAPSPVWLQPVCWAPVVRSTQIVGNKHVCKSPMFILNFLSMCTVSPPAEPLHGPSPPSKTTEGVRWSSADPQVGCWKAEQSCCQIVLDPLGLKEWLWSVGRARNRRQRGAIRAGFISIHGCFPRPRPWCCVCPPIPHQPPTLGRVAWTCQPQNAGSPCSWPVSRHLPLYTADQRPLGPKICELKGGLLFLLGLWFHVTVSFTNCSGEQLTRGPSLPHPSPAHLLLACPLVACQALQMATKPRQRGRGPELLIGRIRNSLSSRALPSPPRACVCCGARSSELEHPASGGVISVLRSLCLGSLPV